MSEEDFKFEAISEEFLEKLREVSDKDAETKAKATTISAISRPTSSFSM